MDGQALHLEIANRREEMDRIQTTFEAFAMQIGLPKKAIMQVMLVLEELVLNTILYGFPKGGDHQITLDVAVQDKTLTMEIRDGGIAFDPFNDAPPPDLDNPTMQRRIGGWGVHIVKTTMDDVQYRRDGDINYTKIMKVIG